MALVGEGVLIRQIPQYIDTRPGHNFSSDSDTLDGLSEGMLTGHEQSILGLWDALATQLGLQDHLKILPMVVKKNYMEFDGFFFKKIADAIRLSADLGVDVINVSQGADYTTSHFLFIDNDRKKSLEYIQSAINYAFKKGVIVFAAASNDIRHNHDTSPAALCNMPKVVCVANTSFAHKVVSASGRAQVDYAYYGENLITRGKDDEIISVTGTSFATPLLAMLYAYSMVLNQESPAQTLQRLDLASGAKASSRFGLRIEKTVTLKDLALLAP